MLNLTSKAKLATLETIEKQASIAYTSELKGGHTETFHGTSERYIVTIYDLSHEDVYYNHRDASIGEWLDMIIKGVNTLLYDYNLDYLSDIYNNLSFGTWYNESDHVIESGLNTSSDSLQVAMLLAKENKQTYIYDTKNGTDLSVDTYFKQGGII